VNKTTTQQPKVQQFESTGFQDPQTAAETSGSYYLQLRREIRAVVASRGKGGKGGKVREVRKKGGKKRKKFFPPKTIY